MRETETEDWSWGTLSLWPGCEKAIQPSVVLTDFLGCNGLSASLQKTQSPTHLGLISHLDDRRLTFNPYIKLVLSGALRCCSWLWAGWPSRFVMGESDVFLLQSRRRRCRRSKGAGECAGMNSSTQVHADKLRTES